MITDTFTQGPHKVAGPSPSQPPSVEEPLFDGLQTLWDEQARRIDGLLATHPEAQPRGLHFRRRRPWRRRVMTEYVLLILLNLAAGIYTTLTLFSDPYILLRVTGYVLAATNACMAIHSLYHLLAIRRHHPARVGTARMSRFFRRMHMEPHYAPRPAGPKARVVRVDFRNVVASAFTSARQVAAASAAAVVVLMSVSCSPIGDGRAMTKADPAARLAAIEHVNYILEQI